MMNMGIGLTDFSSLSENLPMLSAQALSEADVTAVSFGEMLSQMESQFTQTADLEKSQSQPKLSLTEIPPEILQNVAIPELAEVPECENLEEALNYIANIMAKTQETPIQEEADNEQDDETLFALPLNLNIQVPAEIPAEEMPQMSFKVYGCINQKDASEEPETIETSPDKQQTAAPSVDNANNQQTWAVKEEAPSAQTGPKAEQQAVSQEINAILPEALASNSEQLAIAQLKFPEYRAEGITDPKTMEALIFLVQIFSRFNQDKVEWHSLNMTAEELSKMGLQPGNFIENEEGKIIAMIVEKDGELYLAWLKPEQDMPAENPKAQIQESASETQKAWESIAKAYFSYKVEANVEKELDELLGKTSSKEEAKQTKSETFKNDEQAQQNFMFAKSANAPVIQVNASDKALSLLPKNQIAHIGNEILAKLNTAKDGTTTFEVTLNPIELGKITIKLVVKAAAVTAHITTDNARTAALLQNSADKIAAAVDKGDSKLDSFTVTVESKQDSHEQRENQGGNNKREYEQQQQEQSEESEEKGISFADVLSASA